MAMPDEDQQPFGRRPYDNQVPPAVETYVEKRLTDTRHEMRKEVGVPLLELNNKLDALAKIVADANLQSVKDHAEVKAHIERLEDAVRDLPGLEHRVTEIEAEERADDRVAAALAKQAQQMRSNRRWLVGTAIALASLIVAATATIVAVLA